MDLQTSFDVLSAVLERYESGGRMVRRVETESVAGAGLRATMDVAVPLDPTAVGDAAPEATVSEDGGLRIAFPDAGLPSCPDPVEAAVTTSVREARVADDGTVVVGVTLVVDRAGRESVPEGDGDAVSDGAGGAATPAGDGASPSAREDRTDAGTPAESATGTQAESADSLSAVRDESVPAYEDLPYLRALYDACDTFAEMSREIEMDVSSETVRRYMIEAGVHDPTTYDRSEESGSGDDESGGPDAEGDGSVDASTGEDDPMATIPNEHLVTDGIGLPADLTIEDVADAVVESSSMYQAHRRLGIGQDRARKLLRELGLLDLVLHRIGDRPAEDPSYEEVATRIREATPEEL